MCASKENARLSESSSSPDSPPPSNAEVPNSQSEHSRMLHCPPLKGKPVTIPTISMTLLSSTLNVASLAAKAPGQMDDGHVWPRCWKRDCLHSSSNSPSASTVVLTDDHAPACCN